MDVVLLRWPLERERRASLAAAGRARLLLVEGEAQPPEPLDCLEDWVRIPTTEADIRARARSLARRAALHAEACPRLDDDGVLRVGPRWVHVPPVEARLVKVLLERFGAVVPRDVLTDAAWPAQCPDRNLLDVHVLRLRRRLASVGLVIRTVRSRGYLLEQCRNPLQGIGSWPDGGHRP